MDLEILNKIFTVFLPNFRRISIAQEFQMRSCYCLILIVFAMSGSSLYSNGLIHCDGSADVSENVKNNLCWAEKVIYKANFTTIYGKENDSETMVSKPFNTTFHSRKRHRPLRNKYEKTEKDEAQESKIEVYRTCQMIFNTIFKLAILHGIPYFIFRLLGGDDLYGVITGKISNTHYINTIS